MGVRGILVEPATGARGGRLLRLLQLLLLQLGIVDATAVGMLLP